jgi:hypothetical protein
MGHVEMDDVLSSTRQAEIRTIIDDLLGFEPTVVAVERPVESQGRIDEAYKVSCAGERHLGRSEAEQLGFRVAQLARLRAPRGIDVIDVFHDPSIEEFIERHPELKRHLDGMWSSARAEAAASEQQLSEITMPEYVKVTNTREARRRVLQPYIEYLESGHGRRGIRSVGPDGAR